MAHFLYGYPALPKAGLGNMLIPWADCLLWCKDTGARMISPTWAKLRIGPVLRRERDKRFYQRFFVSAGEVTGPHKWALLLTARKIPADVWRAGNVGATAERDTVVCFSDMNLFGNLVGRHAEVKSALYCMTKPQYHPASIAGTPFIGIHIRLGDYPPFPAANAAPMVYFRLPIDWYVAGLSAIRRAVGIDLQAVVFSDGSDQELMPLLAMPRVSRSPFREAITDMLALGESCAVIASRSTFSLWGCYLSQAPSLWYMTNSGVTSVTESAADLDVKWARGDALSQGFVNAVRERVARKSRCP